MKDFDRHHHHLEWHLVNPKLSHLLIYYICIGLGIAVLWLSSSSGLKLLASAIIFVVSSVGLTIVSNSRE